MSTDSGSPGARECDNEPIHIPGLIQPHGLLLVIDPLQLDIRHTSGNCDDFTGREPGQLLGKPVGSLIGDEPAERLREWSAPNGKGAGPTIPFVLEVKLAGRWFTCVAHRPDGGSVILELEPTLVHHDFLFHPVYRHIEAAIHQFEEQATLAQLLQSAVKQVRTLTGFDRVMVYQFDHDYSGWVAAEETAAQLPSWLGLHFPASDIPAQARALYMRNRVRSIPNVNYVPVPLVPSLTVPAGAPLDLSFASLRSVSPIHLEYLRNMRVGASLSVSLLKDAKLWGLIVCHHSTPHNTSPEVRFACDFVGQTLCLLIGGKEESAHLEHAAALRQTQLQLLRHIEDQGDILKGLASCSDAAMAMAVANASGVALCVAGKCVLLGETPDAQQVQRLVAWLAERDGGLPFATAVLSACYPEAGAYVSLASGILAVPLVLQGGYLIWFRPEVLREVRWAGNPNKPVESEPDGFGMLRIQPRKSFEPWKQSVAATSAPWKTWEMETAVAVAEEVGGRLLQEQAEAELLGRQPAEVERDRLHGAVAALEQGRRHRP
jgi:chemotaxis family two-component system sensor kinase Cph1